MRIIVLRMEAVQPRGDGYGLGAIRLLESLGLLALPMGILLAVQLGVRFGQEKVGIHRFRLQFGGFFKIRKGPSLISFER